MRPGPARAVQLLPNFISIDDPPRPARAVLSDIALAEGWCADLDEAQEWAESREAKFVRRARTELNDLTSVGRYTNYGFNSSSESYLQGAAYVEPGDDEGTKEYKSRRSRFADYREALHGLDPIEFEALCAGILGIFGVTKPRLTRRSGDEGIDFYGRVQVGSALMPGMLSPNVHSQMFAWLIGQAKHYPSTTASTPEIRELVGSVELAKSKSFSLLNESFADLAIRPCDPVYYLFFSTGRLSSRVWTLLENSGVIGMDGEMLSDFLAVHEIGWKDDKFSESDFSDWLSGLTNSAIL